MITNSEFLFWHPRADVPHGEYKGDARPEQAALLRHQGVLWGCAQYQAERTQHWCIQPTKQYKAMTAAFLAVDFGMLGSMQAGITACCALLFRKVALLLSDVHEQSHGCCEQEW